MTIEKKLFSETQKFNQWWIWVILIGFCAYFLWGAYKQLFQGIAFGNNPMSSEGLLITSFIFAAILLFFLNVKLETYIQSNGVYVRFFPFHFSFKYYSFEEMNKVYVRKYAPHWEYGGWGLRYGMFGRGKAFNVSGNQGLQLEFKDGSNLLIGTQKPIEIAEVLTLLGKS
ncbi:hypothetical protein V7S77_04330 [Aquirufa ecclesiirivi]